MLLREISTYVRSPAAANIMYAKASASASVAVHLHSQKSGEGPRLYRNLTALT
jgi:hypothetical protein